MYVRSGLKGLEENNKWWPRSGSDHTRIGGSCCTNTRLGEAEADGGGWDLRGEDLGEQLKPQRELTHGVTWSDSFQGGPGEERLGRRQSGPERRHVVRRYFQHGNSLPAGELEPGRGARDSQSREEGGSQSLARHLYLNMSRTG